MNLTSDTSPTSHANNYWHEVLDSRLHQCLESLTALDLAAAKQHFGLFRALLAAHLEFEDTQLDLEKHASTEQQKLAKADHLILTRLVRKVDSSLTLLENSTNKRSGLVNQLQDRLRLKNVLGHHDQREKELLYPAIEASLARDRNRLLADKMDDEMNRTLQKRS